MDVKTLPELRKLSDPQLRKHVAEQREALRDLSFRVATLEHKNVHEVSVLRRAIAQGETLLRERAVIAANVASTPSTSAS